MTTRGPPRRNPAKAGAMTGYPPTRSAARERRASERIIIHEAPAIGKAVHAQDNAFGPQRR
jgi:hypothetical protein